MSEFWSGKKNIFFLILQNVILDILPIGYINESHITRTKKYILIKSKLSIKIFCFVTNK